MHAADEARGLAHRRRPLARAGTVIDAKVEGHADERDVEIGRDGMVLGAHEGCNAREARGDRGIDGLEARVFLHY